VVDVVDELDDVVDVVVDAVDVVDDVDVVVDDVLVVFLGAISAGVQQVVTAPIAWHCGP